MASVILNQIENELQNRLAVSTNIDIDETLLGGVDARDLFAHVLGMTTLTIEQARIEATDGLIVLQGTAPVLDSTAIPVEIQFRDDGGLIVSVEGRVPAETPLASAVIGRFLLSRITIPSGLNKLRVKIVSATVTMATKSALIVFADTGDTVVADFFTIRQPKLSLHATGLDQTVPAIVAQFEGLLIIADVPFLAKGQLGEDESFSVTPVNSGLILTSDQLITTFLNASVPQLPNLPVTGLRMISDISANEVTVAATLSGAWNIQLGVGSPELTELQITVQKTDSSIIGWLDGRMTMAGQTVRVRASLPGDLMLSGDLQAVDLTDLVREIAGSALQIPAGIPGLRLEPSQFVIRFNQNLPSITIQTTVVSFGKAIIIIAHVANEWNTVAAFVPPAGWTFSDISPVLAPLDVLEIEAPKLLFASFDQADFPIPAIDGVDIYEKIQKGLTLHTTLSLRGNGLDFFSSLVGMQKLPLRLTAFDDLASSEITGMIDGKRILVPSVLTLENVALAVIPSPFSVAIRSEARVEIEGDLLPRFQIEAGLGATTQKISLESTVPWVEPFGLSGLTIKRLILDVQATPTPAYGILGDIDVAGNIIRVACKFEGGAPSALVGELEGRLSLSDVTTDIAGVGLPPSLDLSIEDFSIQIVSNPLGVTIGSVRFEPGLSLRGMLTMLGLEMLANVRVQPGTRVFASGSLKNKVEFGSVLVISDAAGDGPPSMQLDTSGSPLLMLSGRVSLLGLEESLEASVERSGFSFKLDRNLGIGRYELDTTFESIRRFHAKGSFTFGLKAEIELGADLGKIVLDTGCAGSLNVMMTDGNFELSANGKFSFVGNTLTLPTLKLTAAIDSLDEFPPCIQRLIETEANEIFGPILENPAKWIQAISENAIQEVENVAQTLKDHFGKNADFIGWQLKTVLGESSLEVGQALKDIGEAPERIASVLRDLGDPAANVRDTLNRLGVPSDQISQVMRDLFPDVPHLDEVVHTDAHIDSPMIPPISQHTDTPLIPPVHQHTDTPLIPPISQHTDTPLIPPVRQHTDTPLIPPISVHLDTSGPHGDVHGDGFLGQFHTDFRGPHTDAHEDTAGRVHADIHNDEPGRGHADIHNDEPGRVHADIHNDEPGRAHADIHNDEPGRGHVDVHGDTAIHADAP